MREPKYYSGDTRRGVGVPEQRKLFWQIEVVNGVWHRHIKQVAGAKPGRPAEDSLNEVW
jgi:hypothetical protein